jgi:hypothetical protein
MTDDEIKAPTPEEMRAYLNSTEYKRAVAEATARMERDDAIVEVADWFGSTGLDDDIERGLPQYLRREFGESLSEDPNALKARDLNYLGAFTEDDCQVHYWCIPYASEEKVYAYVVVRGDSVATGWGNREPPSGDV